MLSTGTRESMQKGRTSSDSTCPVTSTSLHRYRLARLSAFQAPRYFGQAMAAAAHVYNGNDQVAYALVRPPGHHAQPGKADGYCFLNHIGIAIEKLRTLGLRKTAVIDWDVHHGNGTQEGYYSDPTVLTISMHMNHGAWGETHTQTGGADEADLVLARRVVYADRFFPSEDLELGFQRLDTTLAICDRCRRRGRTLRDARGGCRDHRPARRSVRCGL